MENRTLELLAQYGRILQKCLFPRLEEELGRLSEKHEQLVLDHAGRPVGGEDSGMSRQQA